MAGASAPATSVDSKASTIQIVLYYREVAKARHKLQLQLLSLRCGRLGQRDAWIPWISVSIVL